MIHNTQYMTNKSIKTINKEELIDKILTQTEELEKKDLSVDGRKNLALFYIALSNLVK